MICRTRSQNPIGRVSPVLYGLLAVLALPPVLPVAASPGLLELPMQAVSRGQTPEVRVPQPIEEDDDTHDALGSPRLQATTDQVGPEFPAPNRPDQNMPSTGPVEQTLIEVNNGLNNTLQSLNPSGRTPRAGQP